MKEGKSRKKMVAPVKLLVVCYYVEIESFFELWGLSTLRDTNRAADVLEWGDN